MAFQILSSLFCLKCTAAVVFRCGWAFFFFLGVVWPDFQLWPIGKRRVLVNVVHSTLSRNYMLPIYDY